MGKKGQQSFRKQPSLHQLKSTLAAQVILYRQIAAARKLTLQLAKVLLRGMRRVLQFLFRLKPALATAVVVVSPLMMPAESIANSFIKRTGSANPFSSIDVDGFSIPAFADIDNDGDKDLFIGAEYGAIEFYKNTGIATNPIFEQQIGTTNPLDGFIVSDLSNPTLVDIDDDGDLDAFNSELFGVVKFYENIGTAISPNFVKRTGTDNPLNVVGAGRTITLAFVDIDDDGDLDAFLGGNEGDFEHYKNIGDAKNPSFESRTGTLNPFNEIDVGSYSTPTFADIDSDGDFDMFSGEFSDEYMVSDTILFFENTGDKTVPVFESRTGSANPLDGLILNTIATAPVFVDIDGDGDLDLASGEYDGKILYFENVGSNPFFTSTPITAAFVGLEYVYAAQAEDPDVTAVTFSKVEGPDWLNIASNGEVTGTPSEDAVGSVEITIRATDSGSFTRSVDQTFTLQVTASFEGWQQQNFDLPAEAALAEALANPDMDTLPNLIEYALRLDPNSADLNVLPHPELDVEGHMKLVIEVRDDDLNLTVIAEVSDDPGFSSVTEINATETDPDPSDHLKTLTFIDPVATSEADQRFMQLRFSVGGE